MNYVQLERCNLATLTIERPSAVMSAGADRSWGALYRAGGVAALLCAALSIADLALIFILPPLPSSTGAATLAYIVANRPGYTLFQALLVGPVAFTLVTFPALYIALKPLNKSCAAAGSVIGIASVVLCLVPFSSVNGLVYLSYRYAAATSDAQRTALASAAESLLAQNNSVSAGGVLFAASILILSVVMLKGVFPKSLACLGIASGVVGIFCESLRPVIGAAFSIYGILLVWLIAVGWKLYKLP